MKKVKLNIKLNAPEEFKCGDCKHCPLKQKSYEQVCMNEFQENISCKIGYQPMTCPIEEIEE